MQDTIMKCKDGGKIHNNEQVRDEGVLHVMIEKEQGTREQIRVL